MKIPFIKYNDFFIAHKEQIIENLETVLASETNFVDSVYCRQFESELQTFLNRKYVIVTNSCTESIFLALKAIETSSTDEVILPAISYVATLMPILNCNATPVFADINSDDLMLNINSVKKLITNKTKAIILVQLFGTCYKQIEALQQLAKQNNITLIEDAAQGLAANFNGTRAGSFGDISCISFDPTKIISAFSTGGAIATNNEDYYDFIKRFVNYGQISSSQFDTVGYNNHLSELSANLLIKQLNSIDSIKNKLNKCCEIYIKELASISQISAISKLDFDNNTSHKFVIKAENRDKLKNFLSQNEIDTKIHYNYLLSDLNVLKYFNTRKDCLVNADKVKNMLLSLPIYSSLSVDEIIYIVNTIKKFYKIYN